MLETFVGETEIRFVINLGVALLCGLIVGVERELRGKPAGLSTQTLVIGAAMLFTTLSQTFLGQPDADPTRIAAQIVTGIGFLGAGIILKSEGKGWIVNVTTAASVWYAASIGMAIGFEFYFIAVAAAIFAVIVSRMPHLRKQRKSQFDDVEE